MDEVDKIWFSFLTSSSVGLLCCVGISFKSMKPPLVRFALHVILKGARVDEVLGAVDTVELTQASLVEVHLLCKQLLHLALTEVGVDLIEVFRPALRPPAFFEVSVSVVVLLPLVRTPHVCFDQESPLQKHKTCHQQLTFDDTTKFIK